MEGDALVLSALEIIAHFDPLFFHHSKPGHPAAEDPPVHGAPALGGRDLLPYRKQTRLWTNMRWRPAQARQPLRGVAGRQAPPGRAAGAAADGGAVREGQPITRAALQRSCRAVRGDCARGHGGACGAVEHSGLGFLWKVPIFPCFLHVFLGGATKHQK